MDPDASTGSRANVIEATAPIARTSSERRCLADHGPSSQRRAWPRASRRACLDRRDPSWFRTSPRRHRQPPQDPPLRPLDVPSTMTTFTALSGCTAAYPVAATMRAITVSGLIVKMKSRLKPQPHTGRAWGRPSTRDVTTQKYFDASNQPRTTSQVSRGADASRAVMTPYSERFGKTGFEDVGRVTQS